MHRKVHKIGSSLMISLPFEWVKANKLAAKEELPVNIRESELVISAREPSPIARFITISLNFDSDAFKRNPSFYLRSLLGSVYKLGFDTVRLTDVAEFLKSAIRKTCAQLIGFEIVDERGSTIVIRNLVKPSDAELEQLFRKQFHITDTILALLCEGIKSGKRDDDAAREYLLLLERTTDYTKRLTLEKNTERYLLIWTFEKLARELVYLYTESDFKRMSVKIKNYLNSVFGYVGAVSDAVFSFDFKKTLALQKEKDLLLYEQGPALFSRVGKMDVLALHHSMNVVRRSWDAVGPLILFSVKKMSAE